MENSPEFVSYKKVLIFGAVGSGKTTLTRYIEKGSFSNETHTENGKNNNLVNFL
jgi:GTPase SAR1 family protein